MGFLQVPYWSLSLHLPILHRSKQMLLKKLNPIDLFIPVTPRLTQRKLKSLLISSDLRDMADL